VVGRPADITCDHAWLDSPSNAPGGTGDQWNDALEAPGEFVIRHPMTGCCNPCPHSMGRTSLRPASIRRCATFTNTPRCGLLYRARW
jgi:hypothetical protein